ncbi:MAG: PilZ domain-containing protein [Candidatus Omnitrophica bacterium]|nr:PilZ domain-containing protein [Candidatus Omnitrophota bacterium]
MDTKKFYEEKRKFSRVNIPELRVSFKLLDPRTWSTYHEKMLNPIKNISLGGIALKTTSELAVKSPVGIDIRISPEHEAIRTFGRVAWIRKETAVDNEYTMGISFSWWKKEEDKKIIFDAIEKQAS